MIQKSHIAVVLMLMLLIASCKKSSNSNTWTFEGSTFSADDVTSSTSTNVVEAYNINNQAFLAFTFSTLPTVSGPYLIVSGSYPYPGQVCLSFGNVPGTITTYTAAGHDSISAAVTVTNGKISITVPPVYMIAYSDSSKLTAHISQ